MKILIVRFSSFGDIVQTLPSVKSLHGAYPKAEIHWLTREDFLELIEGHPNINKVISLDRKLGLRGFLKILKQLNKEHYTHIYDAHNNLRSFILRLWAKIFWPKNHIIVRSKNRFKRFLFFKLKRRVFKMPFRGALSFTEPLKAWNIPQTLIPPPHLFLPILARPLPHSFIVMAPSAAWETKRWPEEYWKKLITLLPDTDIIVLGGPQDEFCQNLADCAPSRVINLAGKCSLIESCSIVKRARITLSGDTGILHAADQLGALNIGLIGPTAFGYTSQPQSVILETSLDCKPCSKDGRDACTNKVYQKCMRDISPEQVAETVRLLLIGAP